MCTIIYSWNSFFFSFFSTTKPTRTLDLLWHQNSTYLESIIFLSSFLLLSLLTSEDCLLKCVHALQLKLRALKFSNSIYKRVPKQLPRIPVIQHTAASAVTSYFWSSARSFVIWIFLLSISHEKSCHCFSYFEPYLVDFSDRLNKQIWCYNRC